jgi:hypothetical protein
VVIRAKRVLTNGRSQRTATDPGRATGPVGSANHGGAPEAQAGFLCIYEESRTNSVGVTLNAVNRSGATIFTNSSAAGGFFSYGTWAATGN